MAKTVVALEAIINSSGAEGSVKNLKAQLKEAQAEVQALSDKFGATSKEAVNAAKKAAELKDRIGDAKNLTDAFNPDAKFKAFSSALQGVVGGFSALQGAQALFGSQSEELTKTLAKVQGAMALSQGLNTVLEAKDAFVNLGTVIKTNVVSSFTTLKGAIISTGIGALAVGVGLLIANFDKVKQVILNLFPGLAQLGKFFGNLINSITDFVGITSQAQRETEKLIASNKKQIEETDRFLKYNADKYDEYTVKKIKANNEFKKSQNEILENDKLNDKQKEEYIKQAREFANREIDRANNERNAKQEEQNKKEADARKQQADKIKAENDARNKEILDADKTLQEQRRALKQEEALRNISDEDERAKKKLEFDYLNAKQEVEQSKASDFEKFQTLQALYTEYLDNRNALDEAQKAKKNQDGEDALTAEMDRLEREVQADAEYSEIKKQIAEAEAQAKMDAANAVASTMDNVANLIGKQTAVGKAMAIASTTINTYTAAMEAYKRGLEVPYVGMVLGPINAALAVATGIANVKKILSVQVPGGGGGGGTAPTGVATSAPVMPQIQSTTINQNQVNQLSSATSRAFVLESDVSGNQERIERLNRAARIN